MEKRIIIKELYDTKHCEICHKKVQLETIKNEYEKIKSSLNLLEHKCNMPSKDRNQLDNLLTDTIIEMIRTFK